MKYEACATGIAILAAFLAVTACESSAAVSRHAVGPIALDPCFEQRLLERARGVE